MNDAGRYRNHVQQVEYEVMTERRPCLAVDSVHAETSVVVVVVITLVVVAVVVTVTEYVLQSRLLFLIMSDQYAAK